jgi:hypothetical protein
MVEVTLTFRTETDKREFMRGLCDSIAESLDYRLEWSGKFNEAYTFFVHPGAIEDAEDDFDSADDFVAGIYDDLDVEDEEKHIDWETAYGQRG